MCCLFNLQNELLLNEVSEFLWNRLSLSNTVLLLFFFHCDIKTKFGLHRCFSRSCSFSLNRFAKYLITHLFDIGYSQQGAQFQVFITFCKVWHGDSVITDIRLNTLCYIVIITCSFQISYACSSLMLFDIIFIPVLISSLNCTLIRFVILFRVMNNLVTQMMSILIV